jgi:hypothetical protein
MSRAQRGLLNEASIAMCRSSDRADRTLRLRATLLSIARGKADNVVDIS